MVFEQQSMLFANVLQKNLLLNIIFIIYVRSDAVREVLYNPTNKILSNYSLSRREESYKKKDCLLDCVSAKSKEH